MRVTQHQPQVEIPQAVWETILNNLSGADLGAASAVCRDFRRITQPRLSQIHQVFAAGCAAVEPRPKSVRSRLGWSCLYLAPWVPPILVHQAARSVFCHLNVPGKYDPDSFVYRRKVNGIMCVYSVAMAAAVGCGLVLPLSLPALAAANRLVPKIRNAYRHRKDERDKRWVGGLAVALSAGDIQRAENVLKRISEEAPQLSWKMSRFELPWHAVQAPTHRTPLLRQVIERRTGIYTGVPEYPSA